MTRIEARINAVLFSSEGVLFFIKFIPLAGADAQVRNDSDVLD